MQFRIIVQGMPLLTYLKGMPVFLKEYGEIRRQAGVSWESFPFGKLYPCLQEKDQESGVLTEHYFYQDLYVSRKVFQNNPIRHVDIGSRIDGFVAHVASFREIEVLDEAGSHPRKLRLPLRMRHLRNDQALIRPDLLIAVRTRATAMSQEFSPAVISASRPILSRASPFSIVSILSAMASGLAGLSTTNPFSPSRTMSLAPTEPLIRTGRPAAIASRTTIPKVSKRESMA
jgi:hypothetical protein